ncbi:MAG: glycosyltransferase family 2 protein [Alistipes sp.]|nr:glycosyltransferase family 2 protein [Alistipes sp.]
MKVAVVILNYNGEEHLRRFLPSVVSNSGGADIVVADNGSTDGSLELLEREFTTVRRVVLDKNYGFAEGYNRALAELTEYDSYVLLNSDVQTPKGWLEPLVERLYSAPDIAAVGPKILSVVNPEKFEYAGAAGGFIDYLGYPFCRGRILSVTETDEGQYDDSREVFWVSGAAFCVKREVYNALGGLCGEFFAHMEEIDLCWRMQLAGWRVVVEPKSCVYHLGGGTLQTSSPRKIYFNHRNNLAMLFRCASPLQRSVVAVVRPLLDMAAAASYIAGGDVKGAKAVFSAWYDFLRWHPRLALERRAIRSDVKSESYNIYKGMIVLRYLFGGRKFKDLL